MGFSRQEYWSGLPCSPPGDLPDPGIEPTSFTSLALAGRFLAISANWEALHELYPEANCRSYTTWILNGSVLSDSLQSFGTLACQASLWDFPGKNTRVGFHFLLQGIFLTKGSNPGLLQCRQIPYHGPTKEAHRIFLGKLKSKKYML